MLCDRQYRVPRSLLYPEERPEQLDVCDCGTVLESDGVVGQRFYFQCPECGKKSSRRITQDDMVEPDNMASRFLHYGVPVY